jgi:hypothetical protein
LDKEKKCLYAFTIEKKPAAGDEYVDVKVCRRGEHNHAIRPKQIRGEEARERIAQQLLEEYNGSAHAMVMSSAATVAFAHHQTLPSEQGLRRILHEHKYKFEKQHDLDQSADWYYKLMGVADSYNRLCGKRPAVDCPLLPVKINSPFVWKINIKEKTIQI